MAHDSTPPARDPKLDFPAARHEAFNAQAIDHGNDMNMPLIITVALAGAMLIFITITLTQAWFLHVHQQEMVAKSYNQVNYELLDLKNAQKDNISSYRWLDSEHKAVAIPIDRAMELTIEDYRKQASENKQALAE